MKINLRDRRGFTVIESLVAITILVLIVIGATSAVQTGISSYIFSKDQIVAFYLAQEGFEQIRNIRDENALAEDYWLAGVAEDSADPCYFGNSCYVDPVNTSLAIRCASPGNCPRVRQGENGFYGHDLSWDETIFTREIYLTEVGGDEVRVTVEVSWSKGTSARVFRAHENLMNWQ